MYVIHFKINLSMLHYVINCTLNVLEINAVFFQQEHLFLAEDGLDLWSVCSVL